VSDGLPRRFTTSLGPDAQWDGERWLLDLTSLPILHGLSVLSRALGDLVLDQARSDRIEIAVERTINHRENPELIDVLGVRTVGISAEHALVAAIASHAEGLQSRLRVLFGTLQRQRYRELLFPSGTRPPQALVFDMPADDASSQPWRFVLERLRCAPRPPEWHLRITIEDPIGRRLALDSIPHAVVDSRDLDERTFIAGSTRIAHTWRDGVRREAERGRRTFIEQRKPYVYVFAQFAKAGLHDIEQICLTWGDALVPRILDGDPTALDPLLKRVLLALEDRRIRQALAARSVVQVVSDDVRAYIDRSQLGRVLNISLGDSRVRGDIGAFLRRMPHLAEQVLRHPDEPLRGIKVFLIHHITAEVLGLIAALRALGCRDLTTLFVAYAGEAPPSYLGPLLDLPADEARFLALTHVSESTSVEGHYRLSSQYSSFPTIETIAAALARRRWRYLEAMQVAGLIEFDRLLRRAEAAGERCLLIEDGGYLAPVLNDAALDGRTVRQLLTDHDPACADDRKLADVLRDRLIGSIEHTRNGHNRLEDVNIRHGRLSRPAFSIAVSRLKREDEAQEVAASVLNAVENTLHATGLVLSRRHCLVIGCRGAIGSRLQQALQRRVRQPGQVAGIDIAGEPTTYRQVPLAERRRIDLVIGAAGCSVLQPEDVEEWMLEGESQELILASASTKTEEFSGVAAWLDTLLRDGAPQVGGRPLRLAVDPLTDPVSGRIFGRRCRAVVVHPSGERQRDLLLVADLTPVNFMFYGVATEMIDEVLALLLRCGLGMVRRSAIGPIVPALMAVDVDISPDGEPLGSHPGTQRTVATQISGLTDASITAT
jgi:hypothetical protein